jgi:hypothetical protein
MLTGEFTDAFCGFTVTQLQLGNVHGFVHHSHLPLTIVWPAGHIVHSGGLVAPFVHSSPTLMVICWGHVDDSDHFTTLHIKLYVHFVWGVNCPVGLIVTLFQLT